MTTAPLSATSFNCCQRPDIANMDHYKYVPGPRGCRSSPRINRCCIRCWAHWYGPPHAVKSYTRAEWDAEIKAAFDADRVGKAGAA